MVAFQTIQGLYLLGFLVPLVLLYLIRSKPKDLTIPSLMFFADQKKQKKFNALFKTLLIRSLFFLQLLFLAALALSAANFTLSVPLDAHAQTTVVIMDMSASMQAREASITRMDLGKSDVIDKIHGRVSVILAQDSPIVLATNVTPQRAKALISTLKATDTPTRLDAAILLANDLLGAERANIVVYSDFLLNRDDDLLAAKKVAEANDKHVLFVPVGKSKTNLGFIDLSFHRGTAEAFVKNFGDRTEVIDVKLDSSTKKSSTRIEVPKGDVTRVALELPPGESTLSFSGDPLDVDNSLFISNPYGNKVRILFITNEPKSTFLDALAANTQFEVQVAEPPIIPDLKHDLVIVSGVDKAQLLPNTFRDIKRYLDNGGSVIVAAQENAPDYQPLLSFSVGGATGGNFDVCVEVVNSITSRLSGQQCFATTTRVLAVSATEGVLARAGTQPVFAQSGRLFYYGLLDSSSGFQDQISYPLFWDDVINTLLGRESLAEFNFRTGDVYVLPNSTLTLQETGFQTAGGRRIAVNLLSAEESNLYRDGSVSNASAMETAYAKVPLDVNFGPFLLVLASLLFITELVFMKKRGEL
ncbi:MAG: BatA and WFA domain-containing protein [Nanoarchaeota archaeon]|nr:BatA and WFA domain-containing protein [Nanoarchaeota archaeon]